ncbi:MAG: DNA repair protein RecN [Xanthomonadales bacterium]|nr:DNA repair protein RecN [Xanthomonadales bacterium]
MLQHLHIRNFAIVPSLEQDFMPGFTAISGETGAGKSIMVDALGLLLGARSDASWVRNGADRAELTAEFSVHQNAAARQWLQQQELQEGEQVLLRRTIQASGRSRAWINGTPVTVAQLAELGHLLVEVHGQHEHVRLTDQNRQRELLDRAGDHAAALDAVRAAFLAWQARHARLEELTAQSALPPTELEFFRYQLKELEAHALPPDAVTELEQEHRLLAASGGLLQALDQAGALLEHEQQGASQQLSAALAALEPHRGLAVELTEVVAMLEEASINTREAASGLASFAGGVELDPQRLTEVSQQLDALGDLARKHGVDLEALETVRDQLAERLDQAERFDEVRATLEEEVAACLQDYRSAAKELSSQRQATASRLAESVQALMQDLGMAGGQFEIAVSQQEGTPGAAGDDRITLRVSANPGMPLAPLAKVASGGELSRISLAIKVASADKAARTQVYDEIDTGVGGDTANAVGLLLRKTAHQGQALCVTHLAQVAVRADQQLQVSKQAKADSTAVAAQVLAADARVEEIARMLGGKVSDQSRAHAREMLEAASATLQ